MNLDHFNFTLPKSSIARYPLPERSASRLLYLDRCTGTLQHQHFKNLTNFLMPGDLLVFNNTRVIPARWYGRKSTGAQIEILVERIVDPHHALVHIKSNKSLRLNTRLEMDGNILVTIIQKIDNLFVIEILNDCNLWTLLEQYGHIPLPPYLARLDEPQDRARYQTVYAQHRGSVAAPTAGLHFDEGILSELLHRGIGSAFVTLHVGAGTFQPVRCQDITQHRIHSEYLQVPLETCQKIQTTRTNGGRVIAVGTTTVRALETATQSGVIQPYQGESQLFIYPSYTFRCVDALITNFHLPKSSLLMLVCAFGGYSAVMSAYQQAIIEGYRFYSYGDAMLIA